MTTAVSERAPDVVIERDLLRVEIDLWPFSLTIRRAGRRLLRHAGVWVADGTSHDHFVQLTEGVIPHEDTSPPEPAQRATLIERSGEHVELALQLHGGRTARLRLGLPETDRIDVELGADGKPLRLAIEWDRRPEGRFLGPGTPRGQR